MNHIEILEDIVITDDCYLDGINCDNCIFEYTNLSLRDKFKVKGDCRFTTFSEIKKEAKIILQKQKLELL